MPLKKCSTRECISDNIKSEMKSGKKQAQAVAIALSVAARAKGNKDPLLKYRKKA